MQTTALVFEKPKRVIIKEIPLPELSDDCLLVRNTFTGVSIGTERWALLDERPEMKFPHVPGYQGVGVVEQVGSQVKGFAEGDRVFYFSAKLPEPYASNSWMGTHLSQAVVPVTEPGDFPPYVCPVPEGIDDASASLVALAAVSVQGVDMIHVTSKDTAVVLGLGMIGQCSAQVLRARGAKVVVADILADRVASAMAVGCDAGVVLDPDTSIARQLKGHIPDAGADIVLDTTSVEPVVCQLHELLRMRGQVVLQGYYPGKMAMDIAGLHVKRTTVTIPCANELANHEYAHRLMLGGQLQIEPLITHRVPATEAPATYQMILDRPGECLGVVFDWAEV